jgi:anti-sigma factor RsiW
VSTAPDDITCRELVELVSDYLDGALAAPDRERFEAHLAICEACRVYVEQIRQTIGATSRIEEDSLEPPVRDALMETFRGWKRDRGM